MEQEYNSLQDYLIKSGVLENGNVDDINEAKKAYRRYYMRRYKREQRGNKRELVLSLPQDFNKRLQKEAERHGLSIPQFVIEVVKGYLNSVPVIHHPDEFADLGLEVARLHSELQFIGDQVFLDPVKPDFDEIIQQLDRLEQKVDNASKAIPLKEFINGYLDHYPDM